MGIYHITTTLFSLKNNKNIIDSLNLTKFQSVCVVNSGWLNSKFPMGVLPKGSWMVDLVDLVDMIDLVDLVDLVDKLASWQVDKLTSSQVDKLTSWQVDKLTLE